MNENEKFEEGLDKAKEAGGKALNFISRLKSRVTNLDDSGGKIVAIAQFFLNLTFYLCLIAFVLWTVLGIRASMVYDWYYGRYSFNILIYLLGFVSIIIVYGAQYLSSLFLKSYGELVNNTKVVADDCKLKQINEVNPIDLNEKIDALIEETL